MFCWVKALHQENLQRPGQPLKITLKEDNEMLEEVVVVGFGSQKKADLTGAVSQVKMNEVLGDRPVINATAALQGAMPGLMVSGASSPGQSKSFNIRGDLSINGGSPLVLIDNVEGDLSALNPDDIESVINDKRSYANYRCIEEMCKDSYNFILKLLVFHISFLP